MGRFFPYADKEAIIKNMKDNQVNSYNSEFLYPKNGAGSFIKILYDNLDKSKVLTKTEISNIDIPKKQNNIPPQYVKFVFVLIAYIIIPINKPIVIPTAERTIL